MRTLYTKHDLGYNWLRNFAVTKWRDNTNYRTLSSMKNFKTPYPNKYKNVLHIIILQIVGFKIHKVGMPCEHCGKSFEGALALNHHLTEHMDTRVSTGEERSVLSCDEREHRVTFREHRVTFREHRVTF